MTLPSESVYPDPADPVQEKRCTQCGEIKLLTDFKKAPKTKLGVTSRCKECDRRYYQKHKLEVAEYLLNSEPITEKICRNIDGKLTEATQQSERELWRL